LLADSLYGGDGNDLIIYDSVDKVVDGGAGIDTLRFAASGQTLDLTVTNPSLVLSNIDVIDLTGTGNNTLKIDLNKLLSVTDNGSLYVDGNAGDVVQVTDTGWQLQGSAGGYNHYSNGLGNLYIDTDITTQNLPA